MLAGTIYNVVLDTLKQNSTLSKYVKHVFQGIRDDVEPDGFPYISLEVSNNYDLQLDINQHKRIWLTLDVLGFMYCPTNLDKTIVGDKEWKGVLDIEQDIRACLQSSSTLGNRVIDIQFDRTTFEYKQFPIKGFVIPAKILYEQTDNV